MVDSRPLAKAFVGVGSNIDPETNIPRALAALARQPEVTLAGISTFYRTAPLSDPNRSSGLESRRTSDPDPDFFNGVVEIRTGMSPGQLLDVFADIEEELGRERMGNRFAPRTMDLDLLLYASVEDDGDGLAWKELGPHGRMVHADIEHRAFVAHPLMELAPDLVLPPYGTPLRALAAGFRTPGGRAEALFTEGLRSRFLSV